jgi:hypothetical protein
MSTNNGRDITFCPYCKKSMLSREYPDHANGHFPSKNPSHLTLREMDRRNQQPS